MTCNKNQKDKSRDEEYIFKNKCTSCNLCLFCFDFGSSNCPTCQKCSQTCKFEFAKADYESSKSPDSYHLSFSHMDLNLPELRKLYVGQLRITKIPGNLFKIELIGDKANLNGEHEVEFEIPLEMIRSKPCVDFENLKMTLRFKVVIPSKPVEYNLIQGIVSTTSLVFTGIKSMLLSINFVYLLYILISMNKLLTYFFILNVKTGGLTLFVQRFIANSHREFQANWATCFFWQLSLNDKKLMKLTQVHSKARFLYPIQVIDDSLLVMVLAMAMIWLGYLVRRKISTSINIAGKIRSIKDPSTKKQYIQKIGKLYPKQLKTILWWTKHNCLRRTLKSTILFHHKHRYTVITNVFLFSIEEVLNSIFLMTRLALRNPEVFFFRSLITLFVIGYILCYGLSKNFSRFVYLAKFKRLNRSFLNQYLICRHSFQTILYLSFFIFGFFYISNPILLRNFCFVFQFFFVIFYSRSLSIQEGYWLNVLPHLLILVFSVYMFAYLSLNTYNHENLLFDKFFMGFNMSFIVLIISNVYTRWKFRKK